MSVSVHDYYGLIIINHYENQINNTIIYYHHSALFYSG